MNMTPKGDPVGVSSKLLVVHCGWIIRPAIDRLGYEVTYRAQCLYIVNTIGA